MLRQLSDRQTHRTTWRTNPVKTNKWDPCGKGLALRIRLVTSHPTEQKRPRYTQSHRGMDVECPKVLFKDKNAGSEKFLFNYLIPYSFAL